MGRSFLAIRAVHVTGETSVEDAPHRSYYAQSERPATGTQQDAIIAEVVEGVPQRLDGLDDAYQ